MLTFTYLHGTVTPVTNLSRNQLHHLPEAVTWAREKAGLTKTALADECGVSLALISMIESGDRSATPATLRKIARALNCPVVMLERRREVAS